MEDPAEEWEIQESSPERGGGKVGWILNKGLVLGKKMVITGLVISSAPLILPPFVVVSAIGLVCLVPYGVFLASYVCTEKLMSKLLPWPATGPALLEYGTTFGDGEEVNAVENQGETGWFNENSFVQKEEEGLNDDGIKEIGMRIDLNGKGTNELDEGGILEDSHRKDSSGKDIKEVTKEVHKTVEENRNEEDVRSFLDEERGKTSTDIEVKIERITEGKELEQMIEESGSEQPEEKDEGADTDENREGEEVKFEQKIESNIDEQTPEISKEYQEMGSAGNMELGPKEIKLREDIGGSKQKDVKNILTTIDLVEGVGKTISDGRGAKERQEPLLGSAVSTQEAGYIAANAQQDSQVNQEKGTMVSPNEGTEETTHEGGLDLWEHEKAVSQSYSYLDNDNHDGSQQSSGHLGHHQRSNFVDHTRFSRKDLGTALDKALYNEEKIREQMNAIQKIVGYRSTPEDTCIEELKALYLFTGVEPPASLNNHSDLVEVNKMLHFLMSILGVK